MRTASRKNRTVAQGLLEPVDEFGDGSDKRGRVQAFVGLPQAILCLFRDIVALQEPLCGCSGGIIEPLDLGAMPCLGDKLARGLAVVLIVGRQLPDLTEAGELRCRFVAPVSSCLSDDVPVLLLDMALVVLLVGPAAGECEAVALAVSEHVCVDEDGVVVRVKGEARERQAPARLLDGGEAESLAAAHEGAADGPPGSDVGHGERVGVFARCRGAAVRAQVTSRNPGLSPSQSA